MVRQVVDKIGELFLKYIMRQLVTTKRIPGTFFASFENIFLYTTLVTDTSLKQYKVFFIQKSDVFLFLANLFKKCLL